MSPNSRNQSYHTRHTGTPRPIAVAVCFVVLVVCAALWGWAQTPQQAPVTPKAPAPAAYPPPAPQPGVDSIILPFPVQHTVPQSYDDLMAEQLGYDLATPSNLRTDVQYDPVTNTYVVRTLLGDQVISTPFMLSEAQYNNWQLRRSMQEY